MNVAFISEYQQLSSKLVLLIHQALKYVIISTINDDEVILHGIWSTIMFWEHRASNTRSAVFPKIRNNIITYQRAP